MNNNEIKLSQEELKFLIIGIESGFYHPSKQELKVYYWAKNIAKKRSENNYEIIEQKICQ
jgi:hypothetical protein